eukprot:6211947-Pleurochrysis_carterae.AAC.7
MNEGTERPGNDTLEVGDLLDDCESALLAHLLGGEVGVAAGAVPVARDGLGVERAVDVEVFAHAVEDVARDGQLVRGVDAGARADLRNPKGVQH